MNITRDSVDTDAQVKALLDAPADMRLSRHKGKFRLAMPALGLIVVRESLQEAYEEMATLRERRVREFAAADMLHLLDERATRPAEQEPNLLSTLKPFLIKCAIASALFLGAVTVVSGGLRDVGYTLEKKLKSLALLSPEDVEKNRDIAEKIAKNAAPIVRELLVVFRQDTPGAPAQEGEAPKPQKAPGAAQ